jgi:hypothetical protein
MSRRPSTRSGLLAACDRLYRTFLLAYPRAFRREFGPHMAQAFRDCCRQAQGERGAVGILILWVPTLRDLAITALLERLSEGGHVPHPSRPIFVRAAGAAAMVGGMLFLLSWLTHPHGLARAAVPVSIACLIIGVAGLHALLWGREGRLGWLGFVLVGVGLALGLIGMAGSALGVLNPNPVAPIINTGEHAGLAFIGAGMLLWGIVTLRAKALGRWSVLPLAIGLLSLTGIVFLFPAAFAAVEQSVVPQAFAVSWAIFGFALLTSRIDASTVPPQPAAV